MTASVQIRCPLCKEKGRKRIVLLNGEMQHHISAPPRKNIYSGLATIKNEGETVKWDTGDRYVRCLDYDDECRHVSEPLGFFSFAWLPRTCRNGNRVWLKAIEIHDDGTVTLGNRAH